MMKQSILNPIGYTLGIGPRSNPPMFLIKPIACFRFLRDHAKRPSRVRPINRCNRHEVDEESTSKLIANDVRGYETMFAVG
jgi:hypothetical protein